MAKTNEKPWGGIGADIDAAISAHEMLVKAKLDYQRPYISPANHDAFLFFKSFTEAGDAPLHTVGNLGKGGRIVWALARLNEDFTLKGADPVEGHLLLAARKEDRASVEIRFIAVRVAGHNMIPIPFKPRSTFKNVFRRVFVPKPPFLSPASQKFHEDMLQKAKETLALGRQTIAAFASDAERLADRTVDEATAHRYMFDVFQPGAAGESSVIGQQEIGELADEKTRMAIEAIRQAPGQDLETARMTAWGLLNAATYTVDHHLANNQDSRLRLAWFGENADIKKRALQLALELL